MYTLILHIIIISSSTTYIFIHIRLQQRIDELCAVGLAARGARDRGRHEEGEEDTQSKISHPRNRERETPLENAAENPLDISSKHPLGK